MAACKTKAEEYGNANFIYFQSLSVRPAGILCHIYTSCENTRASSLPGTNYYYGKFLMVDRELKWGISNYVKWPKKDSII